MIRALCLAIGVFASACAGRVLPADGPEHGNLAEVVADHDAEAAKRESAVTGLPLVVLIERQRVVAVDPIHGRERWSLPLIVAGRPVATARAIYLPVRGQRVVAVDREHGTVKFTAQLPGEALTGLAVAEPMLVATVLDPREDRPSHIVGVSTIDGEVRWSRPAASRLGIPEVVGEIAVVGIGDQIAALRTDSGREVARYDIEASHARRAELERVVHRRGMWFVGRGTRWVDVGARGSGGETHVLGRSYAPAFRTVDGMDDGLGDDERLRLWLRWSSVDASPRDAILLSRRAVVAARLDAEGNPLRPRWVHVEEGAELVALEVTGRRVVMVREDGGIVQLDDETGRELSRIGGGEEVRGAVVLGASAPSRRELRRSDDPGVVADLRRLIAQTDPRLLPAQHFAADLLWRSDDPQVRAHVHGLARGEIVNEGPEGAKIRDHARALVRTPWGSGSDADTIELLDALRKRGRFGLPEPVAYEAPIVAAVKSGTADVVVELGALLLDPGTPAEDLQRIVEALTLLDDVRAIDPVAKFVARYHADPTIVKESGALHGAARLLLQHADDADAGRRARQVLVGVVADPLCEPSLRTLVVRGLADLEAGPAGDLIREARR
jgi:hypothetical protein